MTEERSQPLRQQFGFNLHADAIGDPDAPAPVVPQPVPVSIPIEITQSPATDATVQPLISPNVVSPPSNILSSSVPDDVRLHKSQLSGWTNEPTTTTPKTKPAITEDAKAKKAAEKEARKKEFEVKRQQQNAQKGGEQGGDKKKMSKAERRALMEKQRAAKNAKTVEKPADSEKTEKPKKAEKPTLAAKPDELTDTVEAEIKPEPVQEKTVSLTENVHPSILSTGLIMADGRIKGSNARCVATAKAIRDFVNDYTTPESKPLSRDLLTALTPQISFLVSCRQISLPMGNTINYIKKIIASCHTIEETEKAAVEAKCKNYICEMIDQFISDRIDLSLQAISGEVSSKVTNGDVVITYGCSSVVESALVAAHNEGKCFTVIVINSRPHNEGMNLSMRLSRAGLNVSYAAYHATTFAFSQKPTKVLLGASSLLRNGAMLSRCGTAAIAAMASAHHVPVLVCCETYKFSEKAQIDSLVANEYGNPDDLVIDELKGWKETENLSLLNPTYDLTPPKHIQAVVTERGCIPPTSVPVILREYSMTDYQQ